MVPFCLGANRDESARLLSDPRTPSVRMFATSCKSWKQLQPWCGCDYKYFFVSVPQDSINLTPGHASQEEQLANACWLTSRSWSPSPSEKLDYNEAPCGRSCQKALLPPPESLSFSSTTLLLCYIFFCRNGLQ